MIATIEDYAVVHELVVDIVSEGVEATVPGDRARAGAKRSRLSEEPLSIAQLASLLGLDKSATSRRWQNARARGYVKNLEEKGKPARIVLGDPLPDDVEILPSPERLEERCTVASESGGVARVRPLIGDNGYAAFLADALHREVMTQLEVEQALAAHEFIRSQR